MKAIAVFSKEVSMCILSSHQKGTMMSCHALGSRLLPTGRKSSLAIFMYSSVVSIGTFFLRYLSGLLHMILVDIGINEDMHNPLGILLLVCLMLSGAWLGYWGVCKLVLTENGSVDSNVAYFVEWAIYMLAAVLILQSSLDTIFAAEALGFAIIISAITRTRGKSRSVCLLFRWMIKRMNRTTVQSPPSKNSYAEYSRFQSPGSGSARPRAQNLKLASCNSPMFGLTNRQPQRPFEDSYYSTFHDAPERKKFSRKEWDITTKEHTNKALRELISSPEFNQWALANAERIAVTPPQYRRREKR